MSPRRKREVLMTTFRNFIRRRREDLGFTQYQMAEKIGLAEGSGDYVSLLESGKKSVDYSRIPVIAKALRVNARELGLLFLSEKEPKFFASLEERKVRRPADDNTDQALEIAEKLLSLPKKDMDTIAALIESSYQAHQALSRSRDRERSARAS
jgi:transcriptional regulator with XRE-family HTH domain